MQVTAIIELLNKILEFVQQVLRIKQKKEREVLDNEVRENPSDVWDREFGMRDNAGSPDTKADPDPTDTTHF